MSDPVQQTVSAQIGPVDTIDPLEKVLRVGVPLCPGCNRSQWVEFLHDASRIAGRYRVGWNIFDDHRSGPDDTVFAYLDALADDGTVSDPGIGADPHRFGSTRGQAVVQTVPMSSITIFLAEPMRTPGQIRQWSPMAMLPVSGVCGQTASRILLSGAAITVA
jgi:hypothetical protein